MAIAFLNGYELKINKAKLIEYAPNYKGIPTQVVGKTDLGFVVTTQNATLEIIDYEYDGKIRIGDRLV